MIRIAYVACSIVLMLEGVLLACLQYLSFSGLTGDALAAAGLGLLVVAAGWVNLANGARWIALPRPMAVAGNLVVIPYLVLWCLTSKVGSMRTVLSLVIGACVTTFAFLVRSPDSGSSRISVL